MGKKGNRAQRRTALPTTTSNNSGQSRRTATQVDGIAGLTSLLQEVVPENQVAQDQNGWDDEDFDLPVKIEENPVKAKPVVEPKATPIVKEAYNYAQFVGNKSTGTVTEVAKSYIKIKTINPLNQQDVTILAVGDTNFKEGNIVSFQFDVFRGKLSACNAVIIGNDTVLTELGKLEVPIVAVEYSANLKKEQLKNVSGKSIDGKFVVLNVGNS